MVTRFIICALMLISLASLPACRSQRYTVYQFDNGDDYLCEGVRRITDSNGKIGFSDERGVVRITPQFAFAFPFENGMSKVTYTGHSVAEGEYHRWVSTDWFYIDHAGNIIPEDSIKDNPTKLP